jgi:Flp pilus assembly protein TadB
MGGNGQPVIAMKDDAISTLLTVPWALPLAVLALVLAVIAILLGFKFRQNQRQYREQIHSLQADMRALVSAAIGVGERVHRIEKSLKEVSHRQQEQIDHTDPGAQAYQQAIKMAQKGASAEELIEICGLTRGEADLIAMLHRMERSF